MAFLKPDHPLTKMIMQIYDASCVWVTNENAVDPAVGHWQFRADIFRRRLNEVFEKCEMAQLVQDEDALDAAAETMKNAGVHITT